MAEEIPKCFGKVAYESPQEAEFVARKMKRKKKHRLAAQKKTYACFLLRFLEAEVAKSVTKA